MQTETTRKVDELASKVDWNHIVCDLILADVTNYWGEFTEPDREHIELALNLLEGVEDSYEDRSDRGKYIVELRESLSVLLRQFSKQGRENTLEEFCRIRGINYPTEPTTEQGAVSIIAPTDTMSMTDLYNLTDYVVSSRSGIVYWLVPRK